MWTPDGGGATDTSRGAAGWFHGQDQDPAEGGMGCERRRPVDRRRSPDRAAQEKFTSLHRKYVWSMCEACQIV
ncbi:hypothetical protein GCM10018783_20210 [Streptomyces griseosporeus]|nr:hypothetical protein GCM10018783_20210 [Streptomyces griseosporeus]